MNSASDWAGSFSFALPFVIIAGILLYNGSRNGLQKLRRRSSKSLPAASVASCSSSAAFGTILLLAQVFYQPSIAHVAEMRLEVDVDEDDSGDPVAPAKHLERQLRRIRHGEPVDRLVLRL